MPAFESEGIIRKKQNLDFNYSFKIISSRAKATDSTTISWSIIARQSDKSGQAGEL